MQKRDWEKKAEEAVETCENAFAAHMNMLGNRVHPRDALLKQYNLIAEVQESNYHAAIAQLKKINNQGN